MIQPLQGTQNLNEWNSSHYEVKQNKHGYCAFANPIKDFAEFEKAFNSLPLVIDSKVVLKKFNANFKSDLLSQSQQNVFLKSFPASWVESDLTNFIKKTGNYTIVSTYINRGTDGVSKRNGIVLFQKYNEAQTAIQALNGAKIEGQEETLYANELINKDSRKKALTKQLQKQNLYVKNLPETLVKDEDLKKFFEKFGRVKNAKVFVQDTGMKDAIQNPILKGKGFGFVCFETQISAALV